MKAADFGADFLWGVAISAAQNEGAIAVDGRTPSIWDQFAKRVGKINNSTKPTVSCDFYHRYKDDLMIVKGLGFQVFRFSISWSRVLPDGTGRINREGIAFYNKVIDECLVLGLIPMITIYHWDLPHELEKQGGWTSPLFQKWFYRFVTVCAEAFGDRVKYWIVLNEPMGFTSLGYMIGKHAPGKTGITHFMNAVHNAILANAEGGRLLRKLVRGAHIGTSFSCSEVMPFSEKSEDIQAAQRADVLLNRLFIEPTLGRGYPELNHFPLLEKMHIHNKAWKYKDRMQFSFDFIGVQNYFALTVKYNALIPYVHANEVKASTRKVPHTDLGWEINPDSFYRMIKRYWLYGGVKEIMITEGGACFQDKLIQGAVDDYQRVDYFQQYLKAALKAKKDGVHISGYLVWTLTDNFEWNQGYNARFGLVHVDFETQLRTIKASGYWFRDFLLE
jgi:beta-glucosidase